MPIEIGTAAEVIGDKFVYIVGKSLTDLPEKAPEGSIFQDDSTGFQYWMIEGKWQQVNFKGESTAEKPLDCPVGSYYREEDTETDYQLNDKLVWAALPKEEPIIPEEVPVIVDDVLPKISEDTEILKESLVNISNDILTLKQQSEAMLSMLKKLTGE